MSDTPDPTTRRETDPDLATSRRRIEALLRHRVETGGRIEFPDADARVILDELRTLELQRDAALAALKVPHTDQPWHAWVNSGNRWTKAAHEARLALGASS